MRRLAVILLAGLGLAACEQAAAPPPEAEALPPPPAQDEDTSTTEAAGTAAPAEEDASPPPAPLKPLPGDLMGLEPYEVHERMGVPDLVRWEDNAQLLQYRSEACAYDLVFYESGADRAFRVRHMEARNRETGEGVNLQACLITLLPGGYWPEDIAERGVPARRN